LKIGSAVRHFISRATKIYMAAKDILTLVVQVEPDATWVC
jgi:hypothetical protein